MQPDSREEPPTPAAFVRSVFAGATVLTAVAGFVAEDGAKLFAASGVFGVVWWFWDVLVELIFSPFEYWLQDMLGGVVWKNQPHSRNWSVEKRIAVLQRRMTSGKTRRSQINAAIRLAEIYHFQQKDTKRARRVIDEMKDRYPDAPELDRAQF